MIQVQCDCCKQELVTTGGLIFGPPNKKGQCQKMHLCRTCYRSVKRFIRLTAAEAMTSAQQTGDKRADDPRWWGYNRHDRFTDLNAPKGEHDKS